MLFDRTQKMHSMRRTQVRVGVLHLLVFIVVLLGLTISSTSLSLPPGRNLDDTVRVDPLDKLNKYRGGFDITNKHYWSVFMDMPWDCYGFYLELCMDVFCYQPPPSVVKQSSTNHHLVTLANTQSYLYPILLATFFTILAIVASGLVVGGNARFHSEAKSAVDIVMETAYKASQTMFIAMHAMTYISTEVSVFLASTSERLATEAADIEMQATENRHFINKGFKIYYIITTVTISFNLIAVIALSVAGFLRLPRALNLLIVLCWLLTILCCFFFGVYIFLERFSTDTCTALESFQENPTNNSLSSILPCNELLSAKPLLFQVSVGIYNLVNQVNANISLQATSNPTLVRVCNPFSAPPEYQYQPENCPANTIRIGDIPKALQLFTCPDGKNGSCEGGLISTAEYKTVEGYTSSIQELLNAYPGMEDLVECQLVKDAFAEILVNHCKPLKRYVRLVRVGMVFLSVIMVVLILIWTAKAQHEQQHNFSDGSVKPHNASASMMEHKHASDTGLSIKV